MKQTLGIVLRFFMRSLILVMVLYPVTVVAQVPPDRTIPLEDQIKAELAQSSFHLGPMHLLPSFSVNEAGYDSNLFGTIKPTVSDWTARVSAGVLFLLPAGSKMYFRGDVLPEYDWYAHHVESRTWGGQYGGSWLGFFNRMSTEVSAGYLQTISHLSSENATFVTDKVLTGSANLEVDLSSQWSLFAGASGERVRYSSDLLPSVKELDRDDSAARAGIRYRWTSFFNVTADVEETQSNFLEATEEQRRDNQSTAYLIGVHYSRERFYINLDGGYSVGRPYHGSTFPDFSTTAESYFASYFLTQRIELQAYGHRGTDYSQYAGNAYYFETRNGGAISVRIGYRINLRGFGEYGTNDYPVPSSTGGTELVSRKDHFATVGGGFSALLFRNASITTLAYRTNVSSNIPGLDRSILRFTTSLSFQGVVTR